MKNDEINVIQRDLAYQQGRYQILKDKHTSLMNEIDDMILEHNESNDKGVSIYYIEKKRQEICNNLIEVIQVYEKREDIICNYIDLMSEK